MALNESIEHFKDYGYVLLKDAIPQKQLQAVTAELHRLVTHPLESKASIGYDILQLEAKSHQSVYNASITVGSSLAAYELVCASQIKSYAAMALFGTDYGLHVTPLHVDIQIPNSTKFDWEWHTEDVYYPWAPEILNVWFPILAPTLQDKTGTIGIIPESHLRPQSNTRNTDRGSLRIETRVSAKEAKTEIQVEAMPGDLLLFHQKLIHRTCPNMCNAPRVTGIVRVINEAVMKESRPLYKALSFVG